MVFAGRLFFSKVNPKTPNADPRYCTCVVLWRLIRRLYAARRTWPNWLIYLASLRHSWRVFGGSFCRITKPGHERPFRSAITVSLLSCAGICRAEAADGLFAFHFTWLRFVYFWLVIGLLCTFGYSMHHSKVGEVR